MHQADALLAFALANEARFAPSTVIKRDGQVVDRGARQSSNYRGDHRDWCGPFEAALRAALPELAAAAGIAPFPVADIEYTLAAYRDGGFFTDHTDILTGRSDGGAASARVLTAVYYFNREPAGFEGGKLEMLSLMGDGAVLPIAPRHNRLVAFTAMARHRVATTHVPGDAFADARFSVNCFIQRAVTSP